MAFAFLLAASVAAGAPPAPPVSAHNCYPLVGTSREMLERALALGVPNIEIDLGWDAAGRRLVVTHDAAPAPTVPHPEFEEYLLPALAEHWKKPGVKDRPLVLTIDWKADAPEAVARFRDFLDAHPDWFSSAPNVPESPMTNRAITVCFTGSEKAKDRYDALVPEGGTLRAFRDRVISAGNGPLPPAEALIPERSGPSFRFLAFAWGAVEEGGPTRSGEWTPEERERLRALIRLAHERGFRVRFYCLNARTHWSTSPFYRFPSPEAAHLRWKDAAEAGADFIATDDVGEIIEVLAGDGAPAGVR